MLVKKKKFNLKITVCVRLGRGKNWECKYRTHSHNLLYTTGITYMGKKEKVYLHV